MQIVRRVLMAMAVIGLAACSGNPIKETEGTTAYTQVNLWIDRNQHLTTNYSVGTLIPVNTQVKVLKTSKEVIDLESLSPALTFRIVNVPGYSGLDMQGVYQRYFGVNPVNLNRFSADEQAAIKGGRINAGVSKEALLIARGFPPAHRTPSTDLDQWQYWANRFRTQTVLFRGGRVSSGVAN